MARLPSNPPIDPPSSPPASPPRGPQPDRSASSGRGSDPPSSSYATRRAILCAVLDGEALGPSPRELAAALFEAGVDWIQLRDRSCEALVLTGLARALVSARDAVRSALSDPANGRNNASTPQIIINKRVDVALAVDADGVHLGLDALDARSVAALFGAVGEASVGARRVHAPSARLIGASLHSIAELEARIAAREPLAYAHLAPIWSPRSKPAERPELGLEQLARAAAIAERAGILLLAQGGLDEARAAQAIGAGAAGIAVTGILGQVSDSARAARALRQALDEAAPPIRVPTDPASIPVDPEGDPR